MNAAQIREQEQRLAALTYAQSPCRAFTIEPQDGDGDEWIEVKPGENGESFLTYWMLAAARKRLQAVGLSELEPGVWTLALEFSGDRWAAYTLRAVARSSWSDALFPLAEIDKTWPEGVVLDPEEAEFALEAETDLLGLALPGASWTLLWFLASDYNEYELEQLAKRLEDPFQRAAYLQVRSPLTGLPRPVLTLEHPNTVPLERIQFLPPQPGITVDPDQATSKRLFKEHWILRLLNPPEKDHCHDDFK
jgi:hypothetical protein